MVYTRSLRILRAALSNIFGCFSYQEGILFNHIRSSTRRCEGNSFLLRLLFCHARNRKVYCHVGSMNLLWILDSGNTLSAAVLVLSILLYTLHRSYISL